MSSEYSYDGFVNQLHKPIITITIITLPTHNHFQVILHLDLWQGPVRQRYLLRAVKGAPRVHGTTGKLMVAVAGDG